MYENPHQVRCITSISTWYTPFHVIFSVWIYIYSTDVKCDGVSNCQPHDCLLNRLFGHRSRKHQSSASLAFVRGIHRRPVNSPYKWPVTRKMFPFDDVIMRFGDTIYRSSNNLQRHLINCIKTYWKFCKCNRYLSCDSRTDILCRKLSRIILLALWIHFNANVFFPMKYAWCMFKQSVFSWEDRLPFAIWLVSFYNMFYSNTTG